MNEFKMNIGPSNKDFFPRPISHRCRHATISKFFGDKPPNCAGACDFCRNPKLVRAQLERAAALSTRTQAEQKEPRGPFGYLPDLYEGGKKGYGFERQGPLRRSRRFTMRRRRIGF